MMPISGSCQAVFDQPRKVRDKENPRRHEDDAGLV
jgi:hypothetical protein